MITSSNCPFCRQQIEALATTCPYCLRNLPAGFGKAYDFDFANRYVELETIKEKWSSQPLYESSRSHLKAIVMPVQNLIFELIDEGHKPGAETIKRNLDLAELSGNVSGDFVTSGYYLGLEFGSNGRQALPITDTDSIPKEVTEIFVVAFQVMNELFTQLIADIYHAKHVDLVYASERQNNFNNTAFGTLMISYRLGVATYQKK